MRKQIAAANWKMNLTLQEAESLLEKISAKQIKLQPNQQVIIAVPFPYLVTAREKAESAGFFVAAQNCHQAASGAYTGEVSAAMISSCQIRYVIIGHSERRQYFREGNQLLAEKINIALANKLTPLFCCGESLDIREAGEQDNFVETQIRESLFHLDDDSMKQVVIAYEPIWAIGTGKTATAEQAQEMHQHIRQVLARKYGDDVAQSISILYGGSVKGSNASELFSKPDVDGGLVGGASLDADDFERIIASLGE